MRRRLPAKSSKRLGSERLCFFKCVRDMSHIRCLYNIMSSRIIMLALVLFFHVGGASSGRQSREGEAQQARHADVVCSVLVWHPKLELPWRSESPFKGTARASCLAMRGDGSAAGTLEAGLTPDGGTKKRRRALTLGTHGQGELGCLPPPPHLSKGPPAAAKNPIFLECWLVTQCLPGWRHWTLHARKKCAASGPGGSLTLAAAAGARCWGCRC